MGNHQIRAVDLHSFIDNWRVTLPNREGDTQTAEHVLTNLEDFVHCQERAAEKLTVVPALDGLPSETYEAERINHHVDDAGNLIIGIFNGDDIGTHAAGTWAYVRKG